MPYAVHDCGCGHSFDDHKIVSEHMSWKILARICCTKEGCSCGCLIDASEAYEELLKHVRHEIHEVYGT